MKDCDICGNARIIRLPVYQRVSAFKFEEGPPVAIDIDKSVRTFPCPECAMMAPIERVKYMTASAGVVVRHLNDEVRPIVRRNIAQQLADAMLRAGTIEFEERKSDHPTYRMLGGEAEITGTVCIVSAADKKTLTDRVRECAARMVEDAVARMRKEINNWGSFYGHKSIMKDTAGTLIGEAARCTIKEWSNAKEFGNNSAG